MPDPDSLDADLNRRSGARPPPRCADARVGVPRGRLSAPRRGRARACSTQSRRPSSNTRPPRAIQPIAGAKSPRKRSLSACQNAHPAARSSSPRRNHVWWAAVQASSQASSFPNVCGDRAIGHRQVGERVPRHPTLERAAASLVSIGDRHRLHDMPRRVPRARVGAAARSAVSHSRTKSPSKWRFRAGHDRRGRTAPARGHRSAARRPHIATKASSPLARSGPHTPRSAYSSGRTTSSRRTRCVCSRTSPNAAVTSSRNVSPMSAVLVDALGHIAEGECVVDATIVKQLLRKPREAGPLDALTGR